MTRREMKQLSIRLPADTMKQLKLLSVQNDTSMQNIIEQLVTEHINKQGDNNAKSSQD